MILFHKPTVAEVAEFIEQQRPLEVTYAPVGATSTTPPKGFVVDHHRELLGHGEELFQPAISELSKWTPFDLGWISAWPAGVPLEEGQTIAIVIHRCGVYWVNACRIVAVIETQSPRRFGFTYGTLPGHAECGEERFHIEMDETGDVWFDILAFSRPRHWLAKLGYPIVRRLQKSFAPAVMKRLRESLK